MKKIELGNYAVARGAFEAGVKVATAYPGTPSTEITEEIAKYPEIYAEWSPNEKVALEVAIGSAVAGARTICSMKHVGLNVAADPLFTCSYSGINAGLVVVVADDPGMHSSQNEQDSRLYAQSAHVPMLEPSNSQESKDFTRLAFEISEEFDTPVLLRMNTRISHSRSVLSLSEREDLPLKDYVKDPSKYVMVPANAKKRHVIVEKRELELKDYSENSSLNFYEMADAEMGIVCSGCVYNYVKEVMPNASVFKVGMVHPLPVEKIREFSKKVKRLIVCEELEGFFETQLKASGIDCEGKSLFSKQGELTTAILKEKLLGEKLDEIKLDLPVRPPVMCPGCPHRGIFYVLKKHKFNVTGDIGCYTLGAQAPLLAIDAVVCMGASIGMAMGYQKARGNEFAKTTAAVIGDSTFVHSGITSLAGAVYNKGEGIVIILDNSTTGMTGHQDHPGTGVTIKGEKTTKLDYVTLCKALGVKDVETCDAYDIDSFEKILLSFKEKDGVKVIVAKRPCILLPNVETKTMEIDQDKCKKCRKCMNIGCPSISIQNGQVTIDKATCRGCGVCASLCAFGAIV